jgi:adenylylsulfate reductase subunit A
MSAPGFNAFFGMGSRLVNSLGEAFMERYHEMGDQAPRNYMVWAAIQELKEGRGPVYMDCRHLSQKDRENLFTTLGYDKDTLPDFFKKKGYNLEGTMIEMTVSEPTQARPSELCGSGIKIDANCASNMPGIFAAGDSSDQMGCLHMCVSGGYAAGKNAADYAAKEKTLRPLDNDKMANEKGRVFSPMNRKSGIPYWEFEEIVRFITTDHFGPVKTENGLQTAIAKLNRLDAARKNLKAKNLHELMRVHEAMNIQQVAKITARAALARKETRFSPFHYRADFTETDDKNFCGLIVVKKEPNNEVTTRFESLSYEE